MFYNSKLNKLLQLLNFRTVKERVKLIVYVYTTINRFLFNNLPVQKVRKEKKEFNLDSSYFTWSTSIVRIRSKITNTLDL